MIITLKVMSKVEVSTFSRMYKVTLRPLFYILFNHLL